MPPALEIAPYLTLIEQFLNGSIDALVFEREYIKLFLAETGQFSGPVFQILNQLFTDVDAFCPDESLRDEDDLDEHQLRQAAAVAAKQLQQTQMT